MPSDLTEPTNLTLAPKLSLTPEDHTRINNQDDDHTLSVREQVGSAEPLVTLL